MSENRLQEAVNLLNGWVGRPSDKPLVQIAICKFCGHEFPVMSQDYAFAERNNGSVCGGANCRREMYKQNKARARQRAKQETL